MAAGSAKIILGSYSILSFDKTFWQWYRFGPFYIRNIIESANGNIQIESEIDKGTIIQINFEQ
ncbi:MAG: hypothetical protein IPJ03_02260 [Ignavibacteriales bacterium]|nr:hypothetical protein [Ignavibacteriales bacterium]